MKESNTCRNLKTFHTFSKEKIAEFKVLCIVYCTELFTAMNAGTRDKASTCIYVYMYVKLYMLALSPAGTHYTDC